MTPRRTGPPCWWSTPSDPLCSRTAPPSSRTGPFVVQEDSIRGGGPTLPVVSYRRPAETHCRGHRTYVLVRPRTGRSDRSCARTSRRVSRILSPGRIPGGDHPSGHTVAGYLERSTRRLGRAALEHLRRRTTANGGATFDLAPGGVYRATPVTRGAGALLPHRFTLTDRSEDRSAVSSLWHCPASRLGLLLATALLCGVRTFLGSKLDDAGRQFSVPRPPGQLVRPVMVAAPPPPSHPRSDPREYVRTVAGRAPITTVRTYSRGVGVPSGRMVGPGI
ncbi:hypothetical protein QE449_001734 [Rhodococcus sp. SORGH_AS303]|nr:hypothetical protein [Rhodococcus sp. SORGH_AS_0303]